MVTLEAFLIEVAKIKSEAPTYREGGDGSDGTCDCIGLVIGAIRRAGRVGRHARQQLRGTVCCGRTFPAGRCSRP